MKKQIAKTITILSLFVALSVGAFNVSAFGVCGHCKPQGQYAVSASAQTTGLASSQSAQYASQEPAQDATAEDAQPLGDVSSIDFFWTRLVMFFAVLL